MSRTVELGRAVLSSANTSLQLWLTTLITISPHSDATNLHQFTDSELLEYLLSNNAWVCRGNGMHLMLETTIQGEPLERDCIEKLTNSILTAPVWKQLHLRASLPDNSMEHTLLHDPGRIRIDIDHSRHQDTLPSSPQRHRMGKDVPFTDVRPPDTVPVMGLQAVHFSLAFLRAGRPRSKIKRQATEKKAAANISSMGVSDYFSDATHNAFDNNIASGALSPVHSQSLRTPDGLDDEIIVSVTAAMQDSTELPEIPAKQSKKRKRRSRTSDLRREMPEVGRQEHLLEMEKLVDGAMRVSISKGSPRFAQGVKLVTHAFAGSLSELCPALWSPHYLPALSQRAHFLPTISRSLSRATISTARSLSLRNKTEILAAYPADTEDSSPTEQSDHQTMQSFQYKLWLHLQRQLAEKPTKLHKAFCSFRADLAEDAEGDDDSVDILHDWSMSNTPDDCNAFHGADVAQDDPNPLYEADDHPTCTTPPAALFDDGIYERLSNEGSPVVGNSTVTAPDTEHELHGEDDMELLLAPAYSEEHSALLLLYPEQEQGNNERDEFGLEDTETALMDSADARDSCDLYSPELDPPEDLLLERHPSEDHHLEPHSPDAPPPDFHPLELHSPELRPSELHPPDSLMPEHHFSETQSPEQYPSKLQTSNFYLPEPDNEQYYLPTLYSEEAQPGSWFPTPESDPEDDEDTLF